MLRTSSYTIYVDLPGEADLDVQELENRLELFSLDFLNLFMASMFNPDSAEISIGVSSDGCNCKHLTVCNTNSPLSRSW